MFTNKFLYRRFLQKFRLPGEAQKIDRIMEAFAARYYKQNPKTDKVTFADKGSYLNASIE